MLSSKYVIKSLAVKTNNVQTENCSAVNINTYYLKNLKKLGINKPIPNYTLDVNGNINLTGLLLRNGLPYHMGDGFWNKYGNDIHNTNSGRVEINPKCTFALLSEANIELSNNTIFIVKNSTVDPYLVTSEEFATLRGSKTTTTIQNQLDSNELYILTIDTRTSQITFQQSGTILTTSISNNFSLPNYSVGVLKCIGLTTSPQPNIISALIVNNDITNSTISNSKLVNYTISGIPLGSNLYGLTFGSGLSLLSGSNSYNGSSTQTVSVNNIVPSMIQAGYYTGSISTKFVLQDGDLGDATATSLNVTNTVIAGTLAVTGASTLTGLLNANGGTSTTTINASSTLAVTGASTLTGLLNANGGTSTTTINASSTLAVTGASTLTGLLNANGGTSTTTISASSTLAVTGVSTLTGLLNANGGINIGASIFTVNASTGNTVTAGTVTATSGFVSGSDYRIKSDIEDLDEKYSVDNLRPIKFKNTLTSKQDIGLIAHELEEHYPFLVTGKKDGEEYQSVNYIGLIGILIHEIKNLKKEIKELKYLLDP